MGGHLDQGLLGERLDARERRRLAAQRRAEVMGRGRWRRFRHWALARRPVDPLPSVLGVLEEPRPGRCGICCSGGGIRSAAFNLGALQALQATPHRVLQRAAYLAAVSGGSYIAAGFAMVGKATAPGRGEGDDSDPGLVHDGAPPFHPGSPEEQYLRNRSSYMAPGAGGKARLAARVLLGVLINLVLLGSLLFLAGWAIGWLYAQGHPGLTRPGGGADTAPGAVASLAVAGMAALLGLAATLSWSLEEARTRFLQAWAGRLLVLALVAGVALVGLPALLEWLRDVPAREGEVRGTRATAAAVGGTSAGTLLLGTLLQLRMRLLERRPLARAVEGAGEQARSLLRRHVWPKARSALALAGVAAIGPLLLGGMLVASMVAGLEGTTDPPWAALAVAALVSAGFYAGGDVTSWSLHPFYRRRLCTAFALKRVRGPRGEPLARERDYDVPVRLSESSVAGEGREWPLLVVCAAANVSDPGATPPGRAVTSFTFSPEAIGGPLVGGIPTREFEQELAHRARDFTLPAAVAISGAALSPSMGKMTRWPLRFLLTLANARLGVWVPNPRRLEDARSGRRLSWRPRPLLLVREMLGINSVDARFLYVTDGGHYENLGLVELLRRGCVDVYCFDASGGRDVQELGDAIALARTELGVEVDVSPRDLVPDAKTGMARADCVTGTITYPDGTTGTLVYVRCVLTATAPHDVLAYHEVDPQFPHNSTGDQLYTDQRFEAYRALGHLAGRHALDAFRRATVSD